MTLLCFLEEKIQFKGRSREELPLVTRKFKFIQKKAKAAETFNFYRFIEWLYSY